ncbi:MAG: leucyl/phenylalanyl-tRNA--protein transferase [Anaerolineae bacterium]
MAVSILTDRIAFPRPDEADEDGVVAIGGDLRPERVLLAYAIGVFPWPHEGLPLLWFSPDPRMVLLPSDLHVSRRLERTIRAGQFEVRLDTAFREVMERCASAERTGPAGEGTWITSAMIDSYTVVHEMGFAHSAEAWQGGQLVGGVYGVSIGAMFTGESMFAEQSNASKVAFAVLVRQLARWGFQLVDAETYSEHLARFGAREWPRHEFLASLETAVREPTRLGPWQLDFDLAEGGGEP